MREGADITAGFVAVNYYERHIGDYIRDTVSLTMLEDGAYNRLMDQCYQTERPLPLDRKMVYRLARATTAPERKAVDFVISNFFELIEGVGYEQKRIRAEIERFQEKNGDAEDRRENERERQRRHRERRKQLFQVLREHGEVPPYDTSTEELQAMLSRVTSRDESQNVTQPVTRDVTANQAPDTRHQTPKEEQQHNHGGQSRALRDGELPERHVQVAVLLRSLGVTPMTGQHPLAMVFANAGATDAQLRAAVEIARERKPVPQPISPAYLQPILQDVLNPPAPRRTTAAATRDADRANTIAVLTGRSLDHERTAHTLDVEARRVD